MMKGKRSRLATVAAALALLALLSGCASHQETASTETSPLKAPFIAEQLGVQVVGMRLTAAGYMLDFRYRVENLEKASPLFDRTLKPYLLHERSGKVLTVPVTAKVGPLRQTTMNPKKERIFFAFFGNTGQLVQRGDLVSLIYGDQRIEHILVE